MRTRLAGRDRALADTKDRLRNGLAVVLGASGVGKSAVLDEIAATWDTSGTVVRTHGTVGLRDVAFAALTPLLSADAEWGDATEIAAAVGQALRSLDGLLVVDDAHLLDDASAALLSVVAPTCDAAVLVATTSGEGSPPDLSDLVRRHPRATVALEPLDLDGVSAMAEAITGRPLPRDEVISLHRATLGYPLFVAAVVGDHTPGSLWSTDSLTVLIGRRLTSLPNDQRSLFELLALAEELPRSVADQVDADAFSALVERGLVDEGSRVRPAHPLVGRIAAEGLGLAARRRYARMLLDHTSDLGPVDLARITRSAIASGTNVPDDLVVAAAEASAAIGDHTTVAALAALHPDDPRLRSLGAFAARFLGELPDSPPADLGDDDLAAYLCQRAQGLAYAEGRFAEAQQVLRSGLSHLEDPASRARVGLELVTLSALVGDLDTLATAARSLGPDSDDETWILAAAIQLLAEGLTLTPGDPDRLYERAREALAGRDDLVLLGDQLEMARSLSLLADGRLTAAQRLYAGERVAMGPWLTMEALLSDAWSDPVAALAVAEAAVGSLEEFDPFGNLSQALAIRNVRRIQSGLDPLPVPDTEGPGAEGIDRALAGRTDGWGRRSAGTLAEVGRAAVAIGHRLWGLCCFIDATRLGLGPNVAADIEQLAVARGSGLARVAAVHARATTPLELFAAAREWWSIGATTYAIEAAIAGATDPCVAAGSQLLAAAGAVPTVGTVGGPLTERQVGVAYAALTGRSNQALADSLFLSVRTVENHLHAVYTATGLDGRTDLLDRYAWIHP